MPQAEPWARIYREAPEIFEAFGRAEDPDGLIGQRLQALAGLAGQRVLEIGCGTGRYSRDWARQAASYTALEPSPRMLDLAQAACLGEPVQLVRACGEALPFRDHSQDRIVATWVLAYLKLDVCQRVILEALRVARGDGIWLVENHWTGAFQELRGRAGFGGEPGVRQLVEAHGFRVVEVIETELRFPSAMDAGRILGSLCGPGVAERLRQAPMERLGHHVAILHRPGA